MSTKHKSTQQSNNQTNSKSKYVPLFIGISSVVVFIIMFSLLAGREAVSETLTSPITELRFLDIFLLILWARICFKD